MQNAFTPAGNDLAELLKQAVKAGLTIMVVPGHQQREMPLVTALRLRFGLQRSAARALSKLVECDHVTRREMHMAMSDDGNPVSDPKSIDVTICQLRKKLKPHGIKIVTRCKLGHQLLADSRDKIREMLADHGADVAAAATPPASQVDRRKTVAA